MRDISIHIGSMQNQSMCEELTVISGLYRNIRDGITLPLDAMLREVQDSLSLNPQYRTLFRCYADSIETASFLRSEGCYVHRIMDNAPDWIVYNSKHLMKHWMMLNAVKEFKNGLWVDWDTYNKKPIDRYFKKFCFSSECPKFTWIKNYWAILNCAVYYLNDMYVDVMEASFSVKVSEPNDELLWASVLPSDIRERECFWLKDFVINIWDESDFADVTSNTYFLHLKDFSMLNGMQQ
jgi:hypothetical protein